MDDKKLMLVLTKLEKVFPEPLAYSELVIKSKFFSETSLHTILAYLTESKKIEISDCFPLRSEFGYIVRLK